MTEIGSDVQRAARILKSGGIVAVPTETVYGLAANAFDEKAVTKIFKAKNRPAFDPLIVHVADDASLASVAAEIPEAAHKLRRHFGPGPLTLVLPKTAQVPDLVTSGLPHVAVRTPNHPAAAELLGVLPFPLAAPSANPFGYVSPVTAAHVAAQLGGSIDYILDGGRCTVGIESTIVAFTDRPKILRLGGLSQEAIEAVIGPVEVAAESSANPAAPGMLTAHYATKKPLVIGHIPTLLKAHAERSPAVLGFTSNYGTAGEILSKSGDPDEAARNLFAAMRRLDESNAGIILAEFLPESGLGRAVNDRLRRAGADRKL